MNIEEIRQLIKQQQAEVEHLNDVKGQLDASRSNMTEEEYNRELENINSYITAEQKKLQENVELNNNYQSMLENLKKLNALNDAVPKDNNDRIQIENRRVILLSEVQKASSSLPEQLRQAVREEILSERQATQENPEIENNNQAQVKDTDGKTRKEQLDAEIIRHQEEILHLDNMMRQLNAARGSLSEEEYNREQENITKYIERETKKLANQQSIAKAYDCMISSIRKLNALDDIIPRDKQDEEQLQDEKEAREEEIKKSREMLPEEFQQEIREIIQKENAEKNANRGAERNTNQGTERNHQDEKDQRTATEQILDPNFKPHLVSWKKYNELYEQAQKECANNKENQAKINNIHNKYISDRKVFEKDENGNVICYENSQIPRPRDRKIGEDPKAYEQFLQKEFAPVIETYYKKTDKEDKTSTKTSTNTSTNTSQKTTPDSKKKKDGKKDFQQIMNELKRGLDIKEKSSKRYQAANVKVAEKFKNELKSGKFLYNVIHFAPTVIKAAVAGAKKLVSKFNLYRTEQTHTMDVLKERIENLSEDDLKVVMEEKRRREEQKVSKSEQTKAVMDMVTEYQNSQHTAGQAKGRAA